MSFRPLRPIREESVADLKRWYPEEREPPPENTFEIGLVLTGGQSAGCYLAGVMDFLFQALDAWHRARREDPENTPNHHVKIKIIVGASAGGLNAAIAAIAARYRWAYATHAEFENRDKNLGSPFYRAWVRDVDITHLLTTEDLEAAEKPISVLNSAYLQSKVRGYLDFKGEGEADPADRAWLDDPLPVKIATSNVNGVPYGIRFTGYGKPTGNDSYRMSLHRDYLAFQRPIFANAPAPCIPDHEPLSLANVAGDPGWARLGRAAMATIAFPVALAERDIERPSTDYEYRFVSATPSGFAYAEPFPGVPAWQVRSVTVDGGLMDNEPFDLAHAALAGTKGRNEQKGDAANRAVIMIDPFVSKTSREFDGTPTPLLLALKNIWAALVSQSQFKLADLALADAADVYSRFLIGPVRGKGGTAIRGDRALASHPLNHYFGYFSEHYRHHDFMLGRHNCYHFVRDWFVLPCEWDIQNTPDPKGPTKGNGLFGCWPQPALRNRDFKSRSRFCTNHRQIIPLLGAAAAEPGLYPWPRGKFQGFEAIRSNVVTRVNALYGRLRGEIAAGLAKRRWSRALVRLGISAVWWLWARRRLTDKIKEAVERGRATIESG